MCGGFAVFGRGLLTFPNEQSSRKYQISSAYDWTVHVCIKLTSQAPRSAVAFRRAPSAFRREGFAFACEPQRPPRRSARPVGPRVPGRGRVRCVAGRAPLRFLASGDKAANLRVEQAVLQQIKAIKCT